MSVSSEELGITGTNARVTTMSRTVMDRRAGELGNDGGSGLIIYGNIHRSAKIQQLYIRIRNDSERDRETDRVRHRNKHNVSMFIKCVGAASQRSALYYR